MDSRIQDLKKRLLTTPSFIRGIETLRDGKSILFDGLQGSSYALMGSAALDSLGGLLLVVTSRVGEVERVAADFTLFSEVEPETWPLLPEAVQEVSDDVFLSEDVCFGERLRCLKHLDQYCSGEKMRPAILVSSLAALLQPVPTRQQIQQETLFLKSGGEYDREQIIRWLIDGGFHGTSAVEFPGEFSVRGHILDIYAVDWKEPVRFEFFGDEIESIRRFDPVGQRSLESLEETELSRLRIQSRMDGTFIEHLPAGTTVLFLETDHIIHETQNLLNYQSKEVRKTNGSVADTVNALYHFPTIHAVSIASGNEFTTMTIPMAMQSVERFHGDVCDVEAVFDQTQSNEKIILVCANEAEIRRLEETFRGTRPAKENRLFFLTGCLSAGFNWLDSSTILLSTNQLFGRLGVRRPKKKKLGQVIDSFMDLSPGDLVIHVGHGLARFRGLKTITRAQQKEEHLELEFADNVVLYVPASKIGLVQRYVGTGRGNVSLAKINGTQWAKQKKMVQGAVFDLALEMLDIQAARETFAGTCFPKDSDWQREFELMFPFEETRDQLLAIDAIKEDMQRSRPMDRLLCGDVGFGKTEVAIRAAFKAVDAGYQVAVLVPTTILAEQHSRVFRERMSTFPVSIVTLSRFSTKKEQRQIIEQIREGRIDIVIGTSRLVQNDIQFARLGLVIIDEEQKFGVRDKDYLKKLRNLVDVLTMTATPIPRTLHFSLLGLRDISSLESPPEDRLPVETKVIRLDDELIRKAVLRELNRGGQVYFLHNRVRDIEDIAIKLRHIVPEASIRVGHAQMPNDQLEKVMSDFIHHKFDVLVSTTIIENGLDIPNANTMFINHADKFGLAELHQLRGRVGRDKYQAYCYLLLDANQPLTDISIKRLRTIEEYSQLGSGFQIAMRDLEIRGAGNVLGTQQSGHIALVGYEMYCDFLEGAVRALKKLPQKTVIEVEIDLPGTAMIPMNYMSNQRAKIDFYRRMMRVTKMDDCQDLYQEMVDRYGRPPLEVERLFQHVRIRVAAFQHKIRTVQLAEISGTRFIMMKFHALPLMEQLKACLKEVNIPLRIADPQTAYVPIPLNLFKHDKKLEEDQLLDFVCKMLECSNG